MTATVVGLPTKMAIIYILAHGRDVTAGTLYKNISFEFVELLYSNF